MKDLTLVLIFVSVGLLSTNTNAALGLPETTARLGYSAGVARLDVDDPGGNTQSVYAVQPIKFIYTDWWKHGNRFWFELFYQEASLKAEENLIGQHFKRSGVNLLVQKNFLYNSVIRPWIGIGAGVSLAEYEKRHTMDDEGYLLDSFSNRKTGSVGILFSVVNEWQISRESTVGGSFLQRIPTNNAITESLFSIYYLVRYK